MVFKAWDTVTKHHMVACTPVVDVKVLAGGLQAVHHLVFLDTHTHVAEDANGGGSACVVCCGLAGHTSCNTETTKGQHICTVSGYVAQAQGVSPRQ